MKTYTMILSDGKKTHFQCAPNELREFTARLIKIYAERGLQVLTLPKEQRP